MTNEELWRKFEKAVVTLTPNHQLNFEVHLTDHCNLNCKQCAHFTPVAEEFYLDIDKYEKDCTRISNLFHRGGGYQLFTY